MSCTVTICEFPKITANNRLAKFETEVGLFLNCPIGDFSQSILIECVCVEEISNPADKLAQ